MVDGSSDLSFDSGSTIESVSRLRAELAVARSREVGVVQEVDALRRVIESIRSEGSSESRSLQLADELHQSHKHSHLIEEYAERLQAVVGLRDCEVADLRSELQLYRRSAEVPSALAESPPSFHAWQPQLESGQDCERDGDKCREELRCKRGQVELLQQEISSLREGQRIRHQENERFKLLCSNGDTEKHAFGALGVSCQGLVEGHGPNDLPLYPAPDEILETLRSELSMCLYDNSRLTCSVQDLTVETRDALQQERELQEAFFEQNARLSIAESDAAHARTCEKEERKNHEAAWQEEVKVISTLRAERDTHMRSIADLSQMVRKSVNEVAEHEGAVAAAEQKARSLQAELYVQSAQVKILSSEFGDSKAPAPRDAADQEFEEHLREVMEIATTFKSELCCVKKAGGALALREVEAMTARRANREVEANMHGTANAVQQASRLRVELDSRDREISQLKSELRQGTLQQAPSLARSKSPSRFHLCKGASSSSPVVGRPFLRTTTPPRKSTAILQTTTPRMSPSSALRLTGRDPSASTPQTALRINAQEQRSTATPPVVRLGARECVAFSPAPRTRILPVGSQSVLQAESAATVHERLRQRILGSGSLDASRKQQGPD